MREKKQKKRKNKEKKKKKLIAAKNGLVEMKEYLETYNHVKYFLPFLNEIAFYAKILGRFSGPKAKVTFLITSKIDTNIQLINPAVEINFFNSLPVGQVISNVYLPEKISRARKQNMHKKFRGCLPLEKNL